MTASSVEPLVEPGTEPFDATPEALAAFLGPAPSADVALLLARPRTITWVVGPPAARSHAAALLSTLMPGDARYLLTDPTAAPTRVVTTSCRSASSTDDLLVTLGAVLRYDPDSVAVDAAVSTALLHHLRRLRVTGHQVLVTLDPMAAREALEPDVLGPDGVPASPGFDHAVLEVSDRVAASDGPTDSTGPTGPVLERASLTLSTPVGSVAVTCALELGSLSSPVRDAPAAFSDQEPARRWVAGPDVLLWADPLRGGGALPRLAEGSRSPVPGFWHGPAAGVLTARSGGALVAPWPLAPVPSADVLAVASRLLSDAASELTLTEALRVAAEL